MVLRTTESFEEFDGTVEHISIEESGFDDKKQYHISMKPIGLELKGKTGYFHEWIRIPPKATETSIPEGSILDKWLQEAELIDPEIKKHITVTEALTAMVGNTYTFKKKKLGKAYNNHEAKHYWVPVARKQ